MDGLKRKMKLVNSRCQEDMVDEAAKYVDAAEIDSTGNRDMEVGKTMGTMATKADPTDNTERKGTDRQRERHLKENHHCNPNTPVQ